MKIACISLGCPKNQVDLDVMVHILLSAGHETVADLGEADVILVNTCGFIESAKTEAIENILEACAYKQQNPELKVIVTGCLAERYRSQIEEEIPEVDAVVGCASNKAIDSIVARLFQGENHLESYGAKKDFPLGGKRVIGTPAHYAYLKIAEGCNNRCHYCAIPGIRGPLHSRDLADCVAEARWLAGEGVKELIVVAQDPTAYGEDWGKPGSICELLDKLNKVPGLEWIRIMYAYPERITDDFIAAMKRNEKVVPYLDLPIQHCNDTILKNMNRRSNRAELLEVIGKLRREIPGITLRTTLIAGFPGETEEQFEDLCNFVKEVKFDRLGCFAYSAEENTVAAKMDGQIDQETKDRRAELVMQIQTGIMAQKQAEKVGQTVRVLCDGIDEESGLYLCRTTGDAPEVDGNVCVSSEEPLYPGQFYDVLVEDSDLYDLYGTVAKSQIGGIYMNLPNKLTLTRIILVPVFMVFVSLTRIGTEDFNPTWYLVAGIVFAAASFTDFLDGHLARKWNMVTDFGKFADPLADKLLTTVAFIYMLRDGVCSPVVLCIILAREFAVSGLRMVAASAKDGKVIAANMWGKVKTVLQMLTIIFYYFGTALTWGNFIMIGADCVFLSYWLCWLVAIATAISGIKYLWDNRSFINTAK